LQAVRRVRVWLLLGAYDGDENGGRHQHHYGRQVDVICDCNLY